MEPEDHLQQIKQLLFSKKKELSRVTSEYLSLKDKYESLLYDGLTKSEYIARKRQKYNEDRLKALYEKSEELEKQLRENATESEKKFKAKLQFNKIEYIFQKSFIGKGQWYIADFYLPRYNIIVELDGGYHLDKNQKQKDRKKNSFFRDQGYIVLRLKNEQADHISADSLKRYLDKHRDQYLLKKKKAKQHEIKS